MARALVIIPARKNSRRLPNKNLLQINGKTLIQRAVDTAIDSEVGTVVVSSDIDADKLPDNAIIHKRPAELCGQDVPTISVIADAASKFHGDPVICLQCTNPFVKPFDLWYAHDLWIRCRAGVISYHNIGKHQELLTTNGGFWLTPRWVIESGRLRHRAAIPYVMPLSIDIDTQEDYEAACKLLTEPE